MARGRLVGVAVVLVLTAGACEDPPRPSTATGTATTVGAITAGQALPTVAKGRLTACTTVPDVPFAFEEEGDLDGIDIEIVRAVANRLTVTPAFERVAAGELFTALEAGRCDLVASSLTITPERQRTFEFSAPYFQVDQSLLVRKADAATYPDLASLAGRTIGVQATSAGATYARAHAGGATVAEFDDADDLLNALAGGDVEAALQDLPVNAFDANSTGETAVVQTFADGDKEQYGFAMRKGEAGLRTAFDAALAQVRSDDTYRTILRRFLGSTAGQV